MATKKRREKVKLASQGKTKANKSTGTYYTTDKNKTNTPNKLEFIKYDRRAFNPVTGKNGAHVLFKEEKLK